MTEMPEQRSDPVSREAGPHRRSFAVLLTLAVCAALAFSGFVALGTWQLYRLQWKLGLIERVDRRVHAPPIPAPGPDRWPWITAESDEYRHVRVTGTFLYALTTKVQASTGLGSGYWLLTPLRDAAGSTVLVNRGFIPAEAAAHVARDPRSESRDRSSHDAATSTVTGLLRISEPGGGFLRRNDPAGDHWYSRDVRAIAAARGLFQVAPYFIDADAGQETEGGKATGNSTTRPVGGLTVVSFHNNHLVYALTWYALALMVAAACIWVVREESRLQRKPRHGLRH